LHIQGLFLHSITEYTCLQRIGYSDHHPVSKHVFRWFRMMGDVGGGKKQEVLHYVLDQVSRVLGEPGSILSLCVTLCFLPHQIRVATLNNRPPTL